jgi:hypothetical protein
VQIKLKGEQAMKRLLPLCFAVILTPAMVFGQNIIVNDSWADGGRDNGADPLDAAWWTSSASSGIEVSTGSLGLVTGSSGRGIHGTFAPQTLGIWETLRVTYTFTTPATVGNNLASPFRVGLMDLNNPGLAADLTSSSSFSQPLYVGLPGYMADFDVNTGATADTSFREHDLASTLGRLLGTTSEWISLGSGPDAGYTFAPNTEYVGVFSVTRTDADSAQLFSSMSQGGSLMASYTFSDLSGIANHFGMVAFWANSSTFGSSPDPNTANNGIDFTNIKIEIPEPSAAVLLVGAMLVLGRSLMRRSRD